MVIENMLGMSYDKPAKHMREYLEVLMPLTSGVTAVADTHLRAYETVRDLVWRVLLVGR